MKSLRLVGALLISVALAMAAQANDLSNSTWNELDSSNNSTSPNGWTSGSMLPSQVEPTARAMMGAIKRWYDHISTVATSTGASTHYLLTYSVAPAAYAQGDTYCWKADKASAGSDDLNVNSLGVKPLYVSKVGAGNGVVLANQIQANSKVCAAYDSAMGGGGAFHILNPLPPPGATFASSPAAPTGTAGTTLVMSGMGATCKITPTATGTVVFRFDFTAANSGAGGGDFQLYYGTGAAPANGAATPGGGAALGIDTAVAATGSGLPVSLQNFTTGQVIGTQIWFDVAQASITGGTTSISRINCSAFELN